MNVIALPLRSFPLGRTLMTARVSREIPLEVAVRLMGRHHRCDWGDVCAEDAQANEDALASGDRILSIYEIAEGRVYILTEHDRSTTTVLFAEEY